MSKQYLTTSWSQLAFGIGMLAFALLVVVIKLANVIGLGKTLIKVGLFACMVAWVAIGIVFVIRGLNKM